MQKILPKNKLLEFIEGLIKKYEVIAPVKEGNTKFKRIISSKEIFLNAVTEVPARNFFIPENEVFVEFSNRKVDEKKEELKQRVIFGLRKCDLNALQITDELMHDFQYKKKRKNTILIGLFCENPDKYCFCNSMELNEGDYDLFFYPEGINYYISIGSKKGEMLVKELSDAKKEIRIPKPKNYKVLTDKNIEEDYRNKIWETNSEKCLSCSACTVYCPTCNCFDLKDYSDINLENGSRKRSNISCQLKAFTRVAGGKSYRDSRLSRFKHFVYHKIVYYKKRYGRYMCVGCGRCLRVCPTKIDWVNTINLLKEMEESKRKKKKRIK